MHCTSGSRSRRTRRIRTRSASRSRSSRPAAARRTTTRSGRRPSRGDCNVGDTEKLGSKYDDLARVSTQLSKLTDAIPSSPRAYPEGAIDWRSFRQRLMTQNEAIAERRFRLAFAGGFSVGKSYLVSMFLGRQGLL